MADDEAVNVDDPTCCCCCCLCGNATGLGSGSVGRVKSIGSNLHGGASGEFSVNARFENKNIRRDPVRSADPKHDDAAPVANAADSRLVSSADI